VSVTPADDSDASGSPVVGDPVLHMAAARALQQLFGRTVAMPRIGRYTLLEQIGAGGMGVVFAAYDDQLDRKVALKLERSTGVADVHRRRRLLREAQTLARLSHPNIVPVFEAGEYEGQIYLTMEFVRGQTVRAWLDHGKPPWQGALAVLLQAGAGLAAAHSAGVVHRDFKPANVLIGEDGRVRVVDFGLARETPDAQAIDEGLAANLTATGALLGTPAYMSPEQFRGLVADARSDQFSFCAVVWEALYGQPAYAVDAAGARRSAVLAGRVTPPPALTRVPRRLQRILTRGLHVDPARRYPSMDALLAALQPRTARRGGHRRRARDRRCARRRLRARRRRRRRRSLRRPGRRAAGRGVEPGPSDPARSGARRLRGPRRVRDRRARGRRDRRSHGCLERHVP
jgi:serine/threonine protein kinase